MDCPGGLGGWPKWTPPELNTDVPRPAAGGSGHLGLFPALLALPLASLSTGRDACGLQPQAQKPRGPKEGGKQRAAPSPTRHHLHGQSSDSSQSNARLAPCCQGTQWLTRLPTGLASDESRGLMRSTGGGAFQPSPLHYSLP